MGNVPVIFIVGTNRAPTPEGRERIANWSKEAHRPLFMQDTWWSGMHDSLILEKNNQYPEHLSLWFYENLDARDKSLNDPGRLALVKDQVSLFEKYGAEFVWRAIYECVFGFRSGAIFSPMGKEATLAGRAPIIYLSALKLTTFIEKNYEEWFSHQAYETYIPLLMKLGGLRGYDFFRLVRNRPESELAREKDYPAFFSLLYFDDPASLEAYRKSAELAAMQSAIQAYFSGTLNVKWDVAYKLNTFYRREMR